MVALVNMSQNNYPVFGFEHKLLVGNPYYIVVLKQSFSLKDDGTVKPLIRPIDIRLSDVVKADSRWDSVQYPSDLIPYKPQAEIILTGTASQPTAKQEWLCDVSLFGLRQNSWDETYHAWHKSILVTGERFWHKNGSQWQLSPVQATTQVDLEYENAYGGNFKLSPQNVSQTGSQALPKETDQLISLDYPNNPSGTGWLPSEKDLSSLSYQQQVYFREQIGLQDTIRAPQLLALDSQARAPMLTSPYQPIKVAGFGALTNFWQPRMQYLNENLDWSEAATGGGYPVDFDMRHWQQAPSDQWLPHHPKGGEILTLTGFFPEGKQSYILPTSLAYLIVDDGEQLVMNLDMDMDTLVIDTRRRTLEIVWRRIVLLSEFGEDVTVKVNAFVTDTKGYDEQQSDNEPSSAEEQDEVIHGR